MSGSGTAAVETVVSGRDGTFSDIDPLSCLLSRAKSNPVEPAFVINEVEEILREASPLYLRGTDESVAKREISTLEDSTAFSAPPNVFKWFQPYIAANLAKVLKFTQGHSLKGPERDAMLGVIAGTIRRVSRADPHTASGLEVTYRRRLQLSRGYRFNIEKELRWKARILASGYKAMMALPGLGKASVFEHDARDWYSLCKGIGTFPSIVITSPCYISAIEYWRRHKLEYCWLGLVKPGELQSVKPKFLGMGPEEPSLEGLPPYINYLHSSLKSRGRKKEAANLARYFEDSVGWISEVGKVIGRSNGVAYVVVGSNTTSGLVVDTPRALKAIATSAGLEAMVFKKYRIQDSYMQYKTKTARIESETILRLTSR